MDARTVLLIDSDPDSLTIYSLILEHHGLRVVRAADGDQGFQLACEVQPSLIVVDPFTPLMDGREVVELLRSSERTAHLPLVVLTCAPGLLPPVSPGLSPPNGYLVKPCQPRLFLREVERVLCTPVGILA